MVNVLQYFDYPNNNDDEWEFEVESCLSLSAQLPLSLMFAEVTRYNIATRIKTATIAIFATIAEPDYTVFVNNIVRYPLFIFLPTNLSSTRR